MPVLSQILSQCAANGEGMITLDELLRRYVREVLKAYGGNKSKAAIELGVDRRTVYRWISGTSRVTGIQL